jgi:hypothetical protein
VDVGQQHSPLVSRDLPQPPAMSTIPRTLTTADMAKLLNKKPFRL